MAIDLSRALQNPSSVFTAPQQILQQQDLTADQKIQILRRWEYDERELAVAEEENMAGGPPSQLDEILRVLRTLEADGHGEHAPTTKHGG